jgi:hypothetical protein
VKKSKPELKTSQEAEARKRELKRSEGMIEKGVDISSMLLESPPAKVTTKLSEMLESTANSRDLMSAAVSSFLPEIVSTLLRIGIQRRPSGKQRPRTFDLVAWQSLEAAESVTGLSKVLLLRACLTLLAKRGVTRIDLTAALEEITKLASSRERGL